MSIKAIVTKKAFYDGEIQNVGKILTIAAAKLPSWAKKFIENKKENQKTQTVQDVQKANIESAENSNTLNDEKKIDQVSAEATQGETITSDADAQSEKAAEQNIKQETQITAEMPQADLDKELDRLINKSIELNIYPENMTNKTVEEQIEILKTEIEKVQNKENK